MLFARAMSNGVKWFTPDVFRGPVYVPEEMPEVTIDVVHEEVIEQSIEGQIKACSTEPELIALWNTSNKSAEVKKLIANRKSELDGK